jgi:hypothetical protein
VPAHVGEGIRSLGRHDSSPPALGDGRRKRELIVLDEVRGLRGTREVISNGDGCRAVRGDQH